MMKGRETIYGDHTVPITSCSEVKYVLHKGYHLEARITANHFKLSSIEVFWVNLASFGKLSLIIDPPISSKLQNGHSVYDASMDIRI